MVMAALMLRHPDLKTILLIALGFFGSCLLGLAMINIWRNPMLTVRPGVVTVPTLFGTREIRVRPGQPVGEYLASSARDNRGGGSIEGNKFVHFFLRDDRGRLVELLAMHREAPDLPPIRRAFVEIAGLRLDPLKPVARWASSRPDVSHWE